ncbi:MAG: response regulator [Altibacter sp.]|uniref:response regulator n=1 Tax=Altibacter sp. TaxID=2024823 RepID=UPI001E040597|nr:response regulator [Altibacter sp.]MBZ0326122.1 response regulator [Altibacter sp.]
MKKYLCLLFLSTATFFGQDSATIDSLKQIVQEEKRHDSIISNSYVSLIKHYKRNNKDSCIGYLQKLKVYANKKESNLANYYYYKLNAGYFGLFVKEGEDAFEYISSNLKTSLEYARKCEDPSMVSKAYARLSQEYSRYGLHIEALEFAKKNVEYSTKAALWQEVAFAYGEMGEIYLKGFHMTETSLQCVLKSDSIYLANNYHGDDRGFTLKTIADIYKQLGKIDEAEAYQKKALALFVETDNELQQKSILGSLGSIERERKNYPQAIAYFEESITYFRENKWYMEEAMYHIGLSDVYFESNQLQKAIATAQTAITLNRKINNDFGVLLGLINKSRFLLAAGNYQESYKIATEAKKIADEMDSYFDKRDALELLYKSSEKLGRFEEAYNFSKEHKRVNDTLVKRQNLQQTKALEAQYKNAQQEQEITILQSQNELIAEQKRNQRNLLLAIIGLVLLGFLALFILYRNRQKTNTKLRELDTAKSTFFENISHEFRTPLSLIKGPLEKRLSSDAISEDDRNELEMIQRNSDRLMELINQLLDISKLESKHFNLTVSEGNISTLLKSIAASFNFMAKEKNIKYEVSIPNIDPVWFDRDTVEKIVVNLLSNAFKYSPEGEMVSLSVIQKEKTMELVVENSGAHFTSQELNTIFERFSRLQKDEEKFKQGSGIGLSLVKDLVSLSHGSIKAENTSASTVKFTVLLPIHKDAFDSREIVDRDEKAEKTGKSIEDNSTIASHEGEDIPVLLVVDDNADIRAFIKASFKDRYEVIEAMDGEMGVDLAIERVPDIIISDIMMPKISGIELCENLKQDERTSHIPIILLTAKIEEESQYQGLELGADDYILKPFSIKLLESRVNNLVASRVQLQERYSKEVILRPKDISINSFDERFIEKMKAVLDDKITDDSFSVEEFSQCLNMSRMQLHRKLKALIGLSASDFLRIERLKLAAILLKNKEINVNEVCYQVGFNNPSYFAKCFKDAYGSSPSDYRTRF